ncbi:DNA-directed RNA polymerase I subunit RPA43 [Thalassophryne amazonica]|uniref:DNA-directed RNA polymerase I subunit RPA43 n=1 Tax=Thalassophryne amazonica TaxID=390379 RepID=UPI001470FC20|nr:DNA-directed RNA polymerase I subunit RPA43 [Thalassophryne amazonica]
MANLKHALDGPESVKMSGEVPKGDIQLGPTAGSGLCSAPSFTAAAELLSAPYSCLVMDTRRRHVVLPPMYLQKKKTGIQQELGAELFKFSHSLKGVLLAYDNIRIVGHHGDIYDDSGYIHMDVEAEFIVFQPKRGQKLLGKVNKLGVSHVGCLVHNCFNASIPKPSLVSVDTWRDAGPRVGAELEFEVVSLDADTAGVLLIRGRLSKNRIQELVALSETSESSGVQPQPPGTQPSPEPAPGSADDTPKKKKKKKKNKSKVKEDEIEETLAVTEEDSASLEINGIKCKSNESEAVEKKRKKKKKHLKDEPEEHVVSPTELHHSDCCGCVSHTPSKKRSHDTDCDTEFKSPKSKKKRKSDIEQFV